MGYKTSYSFDFWNARSTDPTISIEVANKITAEFRKFSENAKEALFDDGTSKTEISSWEELKNELKAFSLKHPNFVFEISGSGEDRGDEWKLYAFNGKSQYESAVIPEFDFDKLQ